jgi:DNA-binding transcriptional LysR family regulator
MIERPGVSGQVAPLEEYLGVTLFQRRPFALTPAGEQGYQCWRPVARQDFRAAASVP